MFTEQEGENLDNILQGDYWLHSLIIQFQHEAEQFIQRITQFSLNLAVNSPVQSFIDHHSQVLQQLQTEAKEAVQLHSLHFPIAAAPQGWAHLSGWEELKKQLTALQVACDTPQWAMLSF